MHISITLEYEQFKTGAGLYFFSISDAFIVPGMEKVINECIELLRFKVPMG